ETLEVTNVTNDDLHDDAPVFSPDGRYLTYTTSIGELHQIFRLELSDPSQRYQLTTGDYNNKEAAYSLDGQRIYFVSDRSGADNIYSLDLRSGDVRQYTNAITGCDRPTVLPLTTGGERLVYASYWKGRFGLFMSDVEEPLGEGETMQIAEEPATLDALPRFEPDIEVSLDEANDEELTGFNFFLEDAQSFFGVDSNQIFVGRVLLSFSDYLGDKRIFANVSAVETFSDFDLVYLDQSKRRQWGFRLFDTRFFVFQQSAFLDPFRNDLERDQAYSLTGLEYLNIFPLSFNNRIELTAGYYYRDVEFGLQTRDREGNVVRVLEPGTDDYPQITAAFVSDDTIFNQWGPATGHRVRLSGSYAPDFDDDGTLLTTLQLDARRYFALTRRSSIALRLFAYDSDGNEANPIFIGGLDTIRGFDTNSLGGNRVAFANIELRFPLIDRLQFPGVALDGIRGVFFFDIGTAYFPDTEDFSFLDDDDRLEDAVAVYGWGISTRLFGLPFNWDFSMRTDLKDDLEDGFETNFWVGTRF
ncbi:MAG: BamA/TamA family outer membrane protein, partial [Acidobacteriota bacterium]